MLPCAAESHPMLHSGFLLFAGTLIGRNLLQSWELLERNPFDKDFIRGLANAIIYLSLAFGVIMGLLSFVCQIYNVYRICLLIQEEETKSEVELFQISLGQN